jgi:hypothetical protein
MVPLSPHAALITQPRPFQNRSHLFKIHPLGRRIAITAQVDAVVDADPTSMMRYLGVLLIVAGVITLKLAH